MLHHLLALVASCAVASALADSFQLDYSAIASSLDTANATVWFSECPSGHQPIVTGKQRNMWCFLQAVTTDICRIALYVATSTTSGISMEAWLPRNWAGRFLGTGNGSLAGCIDHADLAYTTALGFSAVGANNVIMELQLARSH